MRRLIYKRSTAAERFNRNLSAKPVSYDNHWFRLHLFSDISRPEKQRPENESEAGPPVHIGYTNPAFDKGEKDPENGGTGKHGFLTLRQMDTGTCKFIAR